MTGTGGLRPDWQGGRVVSDPNFWMSKIGRFTSISVDSPDDTHGTDEPLWEGQIGFAPGNLADGEYNATLFGDPEARFVLVIKDIGWSVK